MSDPVRARLWLLVRALVTAGALYVIIRHLDFAELGTALARTDAARAAIGAAALFAAAAASALRWHAIVVRFGGRADLIECLRTYAISLFFNQLLPTSIGGDAYRAITAHRFGLRSQPAVESVVLDRAIAILTQLAVLLLIAPFTRVGRTVLLSPLWVLGAVFGAIGLTALGIWIVARASHRVPALRRTLVRLRRLGRDRRLLAYTVAMSFSTHVLVGASLWCMTPLSIGEFADALFLSGWIVLVTALPISIGGWGVREGGVVAGLAVLGVGTESATAAALLWAIAHLCLAAPGAMLAALPGRRAPTALR